MALWCMGCETVLTNVEVPRIDKKVVVYANYQSMTGFDYVDITYNKPLYEGNQNAEFEPVTDAEVILSSDLKYIPHSYNPDTKTYVNDLPLLLTPGDVYTLSVTTKDRKTLTAQETVPNTFDKFTYLLREVESEFFLNYQLDFEIEDVREDTGYYRIEVFGVDKGDTIELVTSQEYFTSANTENNLIKGQTNIFYWNEGGGSIEFFALVSTINKSHYDYKIALWDYDPQNPFSEPTKLPHNIEGGLGNFSLSNTRYYKLEQ